MAQDGVHTTVLAFNIIFLVLVWITVSLRTYVRARLLKAMGTDDYVMIATLLFFTGYLVCQLGGVVYGTGQHIQNLTTENAEKALRYWYFCEVFYAPSTTCLKVSVGFFLLRIATSRIQKYIIYTFIAGSLIFGTTYFFLIVFQCSPISFWWDLNPDHHGTCISATAFATCGYLISALNSLADLTFAVLPAFIVWNTTMTMRTRVLVCILLGFASLAGIVTIVRLPYIHTLNNYKGDFLYNTWQVAVLTTTEVGLGITCACGATFRPLVQRWLGAAQSTAAYARNNVTFSANGRLKSMSKSNPKSNTGFGGFAGIRSQTVISQHKAGFESDSGRGKATIVTTITGRESWSNMPDLELMEGGVSLDAIVSPEPDRNSEDAIV